jgi:hypothetical protein
MSDFQTNVSSHLKRLSSTVGLTTKMINTRDIKVLWSGWTMDCNSKLILSPWRVAEQMSSEHPESSVASRTIEPTSFDENKEAVACEQVLNISKRGG